MWLNEHHLTPAAIRAYRKAVQRATPQHVIIDGLFDALKLTEVADVLEQQQHWKTQKHSYSALYVNDEVWQDTAEAERFVKRDQWQRSTSSASLCALQLLQFLRSEQFMSWLSRIFDVQLTDIHVKTPELNTNYFRLSPNDFVHQHADDSPGREVCLLLYVNKNWRTGDGGELVFKGTENNVVTIAPLFNRCVLFNPASEGAEHWVNAVTGEAAFAYRYNVTSWYWSE